MAEISNQIIFLCALYCYSLSSNASKSTWESIKHHFFQIFSNLQTNEHDSGNESDEEASPPSLVARRHITSLEIRFIQDCANWFFTQVKTLKSCVIIKQESNNGDYVDPLKVILKDACQMFIGCYNSYLRNMEGLYVSNYGIINADELRVQNIESLSQILGEAVRLNFLPKHVQNVAENYLKIMGNSG